MPTPPKNLNDFSALVQLTHDLRGPGGCPWDKEQTHLSLTPFAVEEVFEMVEAIESGNPHDMCEELGDVLFQVILHADIAAESGNFTINDVIRSINEKLIRRHPHVFSNVTVSGTDEVLKNWDQIKAEEKRLKMQTNPEGFQHKQLTKKIFNIPKGLPALQAADKIGERTQRYKFDWDQAQAVLSQLKAEIQELEEVISLSAASASDNSLSKQFDYSSELHISKLEHEMGDVFFSAAQLARHLGLDSETCLRKANLRFEQRFLKMLSYCDDSAGLRVDAPNSATSTADSTISYKDAAGAESSIESNLQKFIALSLDEKEALWQRAKKDLG